MLVLFWCERERGGDLWERLVLALILFLRRVSIVISHRFSRQLSGGRIFADSLLLLLNISIILSQPGVGETTVVITGTIVNRV